MRRAVTVPPAVRSALWTRRVVERPVIDGRPGELSRVAFSPDSQRFAAGDANGRLVVRDRTGGVVSETQVPSGEGATLVAWSPDGAYIATSRRRWSLAGEPFRELDPWAAIRGRFGEGGHAIAVSKDYVVSVVRTKGLTRVIEFLDPSTFQRLASVALRPKVEPAWIAVSPDGATVVTPALPVEGTFGVQLWSVES